MLKSASEPNEDGWKHSADRKADIRDYFHPLQIPFLTTWFAGKTVTEFTVALWYKRCSDDTRDEQGLIHNGGCAAVNTGFQVTTGYGGVFAGVTTSDPYPPGLKQLFAVTVRCSFQSGARNGWYPRRKRNACPSCSLGSYGSRVGEVAQASEQDSD